MTTLPSAAERWFAAGEERMEMVLPPGYGYPSKADEVWALTAMVMNHRLRADRAFIQYRVTYDTDPAMKPVKPVWMDVANCRADPVYDVRGGAPAGAQHTRTSTWTAPEGGRVVAAGGHVHGGGRELRLSQPGCGDRTLVSSTPLWGTRKHPFYNVKPVLHEPGPVSMSGTVTGQGFPLAAGEQIKLSSLYDAERPHTRVMGILVTYFAPDASVTAPCGDPPTDVLTGQMHPQAGRTEVPRVRVPLTGLDSKGRAIEIDAPPGKLRRAGRRASIKVRDYSFTKPNLRVKQGAKVRWSFGPDTLHNVTLASGPLGFSSPNLSAGRTFEQKLTRKGTYKLFCGLHPVSMTQRIVVR
jgi:plastocyanin